MSTDWIAEYDLEWPIDWLGAGAAPNFDGYGTGHVATLVLDLEEGFTVRHSWITDIIKAKNGSEQRISRNDTDRQSYSGVAFLAGDNPRAIRAKLARYAAQGAVFLVGLPHEELSLAAASSGAVITVDSVSKGRRDWVKTGQRVVVAWRSGDELTFVDAVIQSTSGTSITLDVSPSAPIFATIMPALAIYLEPQQNFDREQTKIEEWQLEARYAKPFDFAPTLAKADLGALTISAGFDGSFVTARWFGLVGNTVTFALDGDASYAAAGALVESGYATTFRYRPGVTTIGDLATALQSSANVLMTGTWTAASTIAAGDEFAATALSGAADQGDVGTGATLTNYSGDGTSRPVWVEGLAPGADGVHAMTQIIDHGGVPYALPTAKKPDWFRAVTLENGSALVWQWFKKFMATAIAKQKKFWLSTYRGDLVFVSKSTNTITVSDDAGDFFAWYPDHRKDIEIEEADRTITRARITNAVDNGVTITLTIGVTLASSFVERISWLELCRFEDADSYETTHSAEGFSVSLTARVVTDG